MAFEIGNLKKEIKRMEEENMSQDVKDYVEQIKKTEKIVEYWNKKERSLRKDDIDNDEVIRRYQAGESAIR